MADQVEQRLGSLAEKIAARGRSRRVDSGLRDLMREVGKDPEVQRLAAESLLECFALEVTRYTRCQHCGRKTAVAVPDIAGRTKVFELLANQADGLPGQSVEVVVRDSEELSLSELVARLREQLVEGERAVIEAEVVVELPAGDAA